MKRYQIRCLVDGSPLMSGTEIIGFRQKKKALAWMNLRFPVSWCEFYSIEAILE